MVISSSGFRDTPRFRFSAQIIFPERHTKRGIVTQPKIPPLDINNLDADAAAILQPMIDAGRPWNIIITLAKNPDLSLIHI